MSENVKTLCRKSQDLLIRSALDSRNSVMRVVDFYDKFTYAFNEITFIPEIDFFPNLYEDLEEFKNYN